MNSLIFLKLIKKVITKLFYYYYVFLFKKKKKLLYVCKMLKLVTKLLN